eukprot:CAMPEP_0205827124 /NCGR_PEP_ID=MMETSP0206-20130828/30950_1 /ASSEMBLY_ACC=CAM_ASM_000279 /TAXON_ID=36767 /ORGANISM="Euplotes focardii, Strain TN1" /LENGTH=59 /DNA_ID=CAMNT_0053127719 /DNA_START=41 /DNA_END=220 /DNA_ORIENTATION=-
MNNNAVSAAAVQHDIKIACPGGDMKGENNLTAAVSETPSISFEKDTSIVRNNLTDECVN